MLTEEQNCVLSLLRESMGVGSGLAFSETVDGARYISRAICRNGILLTVYPTIKAATEKTGNKLLKELELALRQQALLLLRQTVLQDHEGEQVLNALSEAGMSCIALKGWEMRKLYPKSAPRQMVDLDILVFPYDYSRIESSMKKLGFIPDRVSSWKHDGFKKNEVNVEMHKRLMDDSDIIQKWERNIWEKAVPVHGNIFKMKIEDYYIFHFVHLHKDFMNGSLGLRRIVDTWLLQKQKFDTDEVKAELQLFGMWTFHERMVSLSRAVMGEEPIDKNSEILLAHAFKHGIYGSDVSYKASRIVSMGKSVKSGKFNSALAAVFLPYKRMKAQFPILGKWPVLLPLCWIWRALYFACGDMRWTRSKLDYSNINETDYQETKSFFEAGGVKSID